MGLYSLCVMLLMTGLIHSTKTEENKPELTSNLKGAALTGDSVTLYCTLKPQSDGWTFNWLKQTKKSEKEADYRSFTTKHDHSYTIRSVRVSDGGQYRCKAERRNPVHYTHYSDALWVNVTESPKPVVIINPDTWVFKGESVTFRCNMQTGGDTKWTYSWYKNNTQLQNTAQEFTDTIDFSGKYTCRGRQGDSKSSQMSDPVMLFVSEKPKPTVRVNPQSSIYTGDRVTLSCDLQSTGWTFLWYDHQQSRHLTSVDTHSNTLSVTISNEGQTTYYCKAHRRNYMSEFSDPATITVRARPQPVVKVQPAESVFIGERVTLTCEIQTGGSWQYHWYRDNKELSDAAGDKTYTITDVKESNKGDYTCKGTKSSDPKYTETSAAVTLTVSENKPELTSNLKGAALTGDSVTLYCRLKPQSDGWTFNWLKQTKKSEKEADYRSFTTKHDHSYTIRSVSVSDGGQYRCRAERRNPVHYTHYSDALWVNVTESPKPMVIINPDTRVFRGESVTFRCNMQTGGDTEWTYSWYKNNTQLQNTAQEFTDTIDFSGKYTCRGRQGDSKSSQMSDPVMLFVSEKPKPTVRVNPQSSIYTGDRVTLSCDLQSTGWTFLWYDHQQSRHLSSVDTHSNTLSVTISNEGQTTYYCKAHRRNYMSEFSDPATITVRARPQPVVKVQPAESVFIGERVTLTCEIQTGGSWQYNWYRDNTELSDAAGDKTYTITDVKESNKGDYTCKGTKSSDPKYTETSAAVTLTVSENKPELTSNLKGAALTGDSVTLYCRLKPQSDGWTFNWLKQTKKSEKEADYRSFTTKHDHSYTIRSVRVSDGGQYRCKAERRNPVHYTHYSDALWVNVTGE
ncbi:carcinoembryonic antigen-related cell adhesion molecule 5-like isoform X1 [Clarias gariepinus]|uniref:carcinoembryonic antigen-related cell adhesion molecule 5-like isoform X1 n=1 Tax=Clarias gariepinus TaxID=13013 RepID=UPI00234CC51B|nr:carcinoembryonic antigen-related cell adhesion molecule 5-like isoform X1 [Clarias gariepinus]